MITRFKAIWRRQPTIVLQTANALLAFLVTFQMPGLSATNAGAITALGAAVIGVWNAWKVRPVTPAVWQTLVTTGAALLATYGLHFSQERIGTLQLAVISVVALLTWQSVSPTDAPAGGVVVPPGTPDDQVPLRRSTY